jgi:hypothetical protein
VSLGYLGELLSISDYMRTSSTVKLYTRGQLAIAFQASVGWFYYLDPDAADVWGEEWFRPIVIRAHDILVQDNWCGFST